MKRIALTPLALAAQLACNEAPGPADVDSGDTLDTADAPDTGDTARDTEETGDTEDTDPDPLADVRLNELMAANTAGPTDEAGDHEDWVELYNTSARVADVSGWGLTDGASAWHLPDGTHIAPGGHLRIWADGEPGDLHADFKLKAGGATLSLTLPNGGLVDQVVYPALLPDQVYARLRDAHPTWAVTTAYTINTPNDSDWVVLNELLASNDAGATDENGDHEGWIELYNASAGPFDLSGWGLTDDLGTVPWPLPADTVLQPGAHLLIWCDDTAADGPLHSDFKLSADGETVTLLDPAGLAFDAVAFPALTADQSYRRTTDGAATWETSNSPSPGLANP